jgi:hypothetical protein
MRNPFLAVVGLMITLLALPSKGMAGEQEIGGLHRINTSTMHVQGTQWRDFTSTGHSLQIDLQSDQPAILEFNLTGGVSNPNFSVWGEAGSINVDPIIGLNISTASFTEKGGSNLNVSGIQSETTTFTGIRGLQTGTRY